jgi:ATP-dependent helicase/nuclease subunit A
VTSTSPHVYLRASAGTGKTWRLSSHFLGLLLRGVAPERVLATTFTRKAAGEIQERVLERLLEVIDEPAGRSQALDALSASRPGRAVERAECAALLAKLVRDPSGFRVMTLDAFFAELARAFALDLDLGPQWRIASDIEDRELRAEALASVLGEWSAAERRESFSGLHQGRAERSVHASLLKIVAGGHGLACESEASAWRGCELPRELDALELALWIARLDALEAPRNKGKDQKPDKRWADALEFLRALARSGDWCTFVTEGLVSKAVEGIALFYGKPISDEAREVLGTLVLHKAVPQTGRLLVRQTSAARLLLERFDALYRALQRDRGLVRFDDLPRALCPGSAGTSRPLEERELDLWFRIDGRIDHLLLDEFQDTSPLQWRALSPLAEEVLADGTGERSFFCVGDEKQSIYGWRDAEPRLFAGLPARYPALAEADPLVQSRRSSQIVLDAVNLVFAKLGSNPVLAGGDAPACGPAVAERWSRGYLAHVPFRAKPGSARLWRAPIREEGDEGPKPEIELAVERVCWLARRAPAASIGVLVRTRKSINELISLLRDRGVDASGEGGTPLTDAEPVQVLLSALHLADHPGDTAAAFHVRTSPLAAAFGLKREEDAARASRQLRARLVGEGYGAVAASLALAVERAPAWNGWDRERFRQLVELAHAHDERPSLRPTDFARLVRETPVEASSGSRVRVMTIHASKGLEFDAVVLPQLRESLTGKPKRKHETWIGLRRDPFGAVERVTVKPEEWLARHCPELEEVVRANEEREVVDSLCVLYVAMTRARHCLEMILPPGPSGKWTAHDFARLLWSALAGAEPTEGAAPLPEHVVWQHPENDDDWYAGCESRTRAEAEAAETPLETPVVRLAPSRGARLAARRTASGAEGGAPDAARLLAPRESEATRRGSVLHRWLEECEWIEELAIDDERLLALAESIEPDLSARRAALELWHSTLAQPAIRALLSRPAEGSCRVERERRFALIEADESGEAHWSGAIDRLVVRLADGKPVSADVIDFKTDAIGTDALDARVAFYRPQLEAYRRIAARLLGLAPERVTARLAFLVPGVVVEITALHGDSTVSPSLP